jgi:hypothetical protein
MKNKANWQQSKTRNLKMAKVSTYAGAKVHRVYLFLEPSAKILQPQIRLFVTASVQSHSFKS